METKRLTDTRIIEHNSRTAAPCVSKSGDCYIITKARIGDYEDGAEPVLEAMTDVAVRATQREAEEHVARIYDADDADKATHSTYIVRYHHVPDTRALKVWESNDGTITLELDVYGRTAWMLGYSSADVATAAADIEAIANGADPVADGWTCDPIEPGTDMSDWADEILAYIKSGDHEEARRADTLGGSGERLFEALGIDC